MSRFKAEYKDRRKNWRIKWLMMTLIFLVTVGVVIFIFVNRYSYITKPIIKTADGSDVSLYIPTNADYQYVKNEIASLNVLKSIKAD